MTPAEKKEFEKLKQANLETMALLEELRNKPSAQPNRYVTAAKEGVSRVVLNTVRDPSSTLGGLVFGGSIIATNWGHLDPSIIAEAIAFAGMGGMSNSRGDHNEFG